MAVITFAAGAPLSGFWNWAAQQNMLPLCQPSAGGSLELLAKKLTWGTYAEAGDSVRFSAFLASGSAVIDYGGQWMDDAGIYKRYNQTLSVTSAASPVRVTQPASPGWYRDAAVSLQTAGITGQTLYVTHELGRTNGGGFAPIAMLAQGWLSSTAPVGNQNPPPADGGGGGGGGCCITDHAFAAGIGLQSASVTIPVAAGTNIRITSIIGTLTTSAVAGARYINATVSGSGDLSGFNVFATNVQAPGTVQGYQWLSGVERSVSPLTNQEILPLPENTWFSNEVTVQLQQTNPDAGDDWGTPLVGYEIRS